MGDGQTIGIWVGEDEDIVERFDRQLDKGKTNSYSRSKEIKKAMELHLEVEDLLESLEYDFPDARAKRAWLRQALLDHYRREQVLE